jgi:cellulose synthase/poly-beta-1,6-N-acetylglucosamine synthase-like glycosyltransferase
MEIILIILIFIVIHGYGGYTIPILLERIFYSPNRTYKIEGEKKHTISIVIAAYNEESCIADKITNTLSIEYPKTLLDILIVTDGSTDRTFEIASRFDGVRCFHENTRKGKMAAIDRIIPYVDSEITVFTDANTYLNKDCLTAINRRFLNQHVGGVAGEKKVEILNTIDSNTSSQEGIYWKYESFLKQIDSDFYSVVGAAGELYAIRTSLYKYPGENVILDDFLVSMNICKEGFVIKYEPGAYALELPSSNLIEESKRKIRIAAGGIQSILLLIDLLNVIKYKKLSYLYFSHRVLRWTIIPIALIFIFCITFILFLQKNTIWISICLLFQSIFYSLGLLGSFIRGSKYLNKFTSIPHYFIFMNVAQIKGIIRFFRGKQTSVWEKVNRLQ